MFRYLAAFVAVAVLLVAAGSASAHGGGVVVSRGGVVVRDFGHGAVIVDRGVVVQRGVVVRGSNRNFFNQNGGRNRFGFRR